MGVAAMADTDLQQLFWRAFDRLEYWFVQARLWAADVVHGAPCNSDITD